MKASYQEMLGELNALLGALERDGVTIDELSTKLDEAYELVEKLKARLTETEARVEEVINSRVSAKPPALPEASE